MVSYARHVALLDSVHSPADLRGLDAEQLPQLAQEIREFLIHEVAQSGGHLGPNLGVVELTIALHRMFESPSDPMVWDTGHQSYVHKILTGRRDFTKLRQKGGLAGYPQRSESEHDIVASSHASSVHGLPSSHTTGASIGEPAQVFVAHVSSLVHGFASSQDALLAENTQPLTGSQLLSVHTLPSVQLA